MSDRPHDLASVIERVEACLADIHRIPSVDDLRLILAAAKASQDTSADAENWRALMSCERIRIMGRTGDFNHIGVEFWREHPDKHPSAEYPQEQSRADFAKFVAAIRARGQS